MKVESQKICTNDVVLVAWMKFEKIAIQNWNVANFTKKKLRLSASIKNEWNFPVGGQ